MQPDKTQIQTHIEFLFKDTPTEYSDGRIEIAYTGAHTGAISSANYFGLDQLNDAVDFIVTKNMVEGINVYVGAALRTPNGAPFGRSSIADYYASTCLWADIDSQAAAEGAKDAYAALPPHMVVVTGRTPHKRFQAWWKLSKIQDNPASLKEALSGLKHALSGDPAVVDASRVMRVGGTVAWPKKEGRVTEPTKVFKVNEGLYDFEQIEAAYPPQLITDARTGETRIDDGKPRNPFTGTLEVQKLLEATREPGHWNSNMLIAIGSMVGRGWSDEQIRIACAPYSHGAENDSDIIEILNRTRVKFKVGDGEKAAQEQQEAITDFNIQDWSVRNKFKGEAPEMEWLIEGILPAQAPMMLAAIGGIGKSFKMLEIALSVSCCVSSNGIIQKRILGGPIAKYGNTVIITAEDSESSIHRRLNKIDPNEHRNAGKYQTYIVPTSELKQGTAPIISQTNDGMKVTEFYNSLYKQLKDIPDLRLVVIDPLQAFVDGDISSSNEVAQAVFSRCIIPLSTQLKCTVLVVHHMNKEGGLGRILTGRDARKAIRGVTGLVDGGRGTYCLWEPADDVKLALAAHFGEDKDPENFAQGAVVKFNDEHNHEITTFYRGENGVLEDMGHIDILGAGVITLTNEQAGNALREIRMAWESGNPYRASTQSPRCIVKWLMKTFNIKKQQAQWQRDNWLCPPLGSEPLIEERLYKDAQRKERMGLYVKRIP